MYGFIRGWLGFCVGFSWVVAGCLGWVVEVDSKREVYLMEVVHAWIEAVYDVFLTGCNGGTRIVREGGFGVVGHGDVAC